MSKILAIASIIAFNAVGCCHTSSIPPLTDVEWIMPRTPEKRHVASIPIYKNKPFTPTKEGIFLDSISSSNLLFNIDELDTHIEKQEELIKEMKRYYNAK